jgi:hypothetical protein
MKNNDDKQQKDLGYEWKLTDEEAEGRGVQSQSDMARRVFPGA